MPLPPLILPNVNAPLGTTRGGGYPRVTNNNFIVVGDSRTAFNSDTATLYSMIQSAARAYAGWLGAYTGYAGACVGNFGVNTSTIQDTTTRRTAQGLATGVSPTWRAQYATQSPAKDAAVAIFLIGVNNASDTIATDGPLYDTLFGAEIDGGRQCIVICNEIPNNNASGNGQANLNRSNYLSNWPDSSTGLTGSQKASYRAKRVIVNTYDALAAAPGSLYGQGGDAVTLSPIYGDTLHPNNRGFIIFGYTVGATLGRIFAASGFTPRNALPAVGLSDSTQSIFGTTLTDFTATTAITATNGETPGTGGANMDGSGGVGVAGVVPNNGAGAAMTLTRSANLQTFLNGTQDGTYQLNVTSSIVAVNGRNNLQIDISSNGKLLPATGTLQLTLNFGRSLNQANTQALNLNSKNICGLSRVAFPALQTGLGSCGVEMSITGPSYNPGVYFTLWDGVNTLGDISNPNAFDSNVMTNNLPLPADFDVAAGTRNFNVFVRFLLINNVAINTSIQIAATGLFTGR